MLASERPEEMLTIVESFVAETLDSSIPGLDRCEQAVAMLEYEPTRPIAAIAAELGVSHGHLDREFTRVVGLSPRALARLLRLQRLLAGIDVGGDVEWADLAVKLGWFDQAHLIRDFKRHTGVTPTRLRVVNSFRVEFAEGVCSGISGLSRRQFTSCGAQLRSEPGAVVCWRSWAAV